MNGSDHVTLTETPVMTSETPLTSYTRSDVIIISVLVVAVIIVIVVGNAIVVGLVVINRRMRPVQNLFIASLALSDLFVGLLIMPLSLVNELIGYWCFGMVLCELWLAFDVLLCTASILNLCLISVDRYLCITRAMSYPSWRTKQRAMWMIAVVWLLAMLVCFPPLAGWKRPQPMKNGVPLCVLSSETGYVVYSTLGSFFIPLVVMLAVYIQIYRAVRHQVRRRLSLRYEAGADLPKTRPRPEEVCRIIRRNDDTPVPPSDEELEELEMDLVAYHQEEEEEEEEEGEKGEEPMTNPSNTDEELEKCPTDEAGSWGVVETTQEFNDTKHEEFHNKTQEVGGIPDTVRCTQDGGTTTPPTGLLVAQPSSSDTSAATQDSHALIVGGGISVNSTKCKQTRKRSVSVYRLWRWHPRHRHLNGVFTGCFKRRRHKVPLLREHPSKKDNHHHQHKDHHKDPRKGRVARARERRLTVILGVIMAAFVFCWFPFFSTYLVSSLTGFQVPKTVFDVFFWGGYCNSALNPVIYTIFNRDIRLCKSRGP